MIIVTFRTDKRDAELGLYDGQERIDYRIWDAHRKLSETITKQLIDMLLSADKRLHNIDGLAVFKGPGSFTGLRIGMSVANGLAYGLGKPIVAAGDDDWIETAIGKLIDGQTQYPVVPEYGAAPHITAPKR